MIVPKMCMRTTTASTVGQRAQMHLADLGVVLKPV